MAGGQPLRNPDAAAREGRTAMSRWIIDAPRTLGLGDVAALRVRLISGSIAVLGTDDDPALDVAGVAGQPLLVTHEAGILTISYEDLQPGGLRSWLRPQRHSAEVTVTVPRGCPVQLGAVTASTIVSGVAAKVSAKTVSGGITLDRVTGTVDAKTASGDLEARGLDGGIAFNSVSGELTLADGLVARLDAKTVSGRVTADVELHDGADLRVATVSGDVAVRLPGRCSARVELRSVSGRVRSGFEAVAAADGRRPAAATGTLGSGSASITAVSMTGDVTLLAREAQPAAGTAGPAGSRGAESGGGDAQ
jgi:Putative adhesin